MPGLAWKCRSPRWKQRPNRKPDHRPIGESSGEDEPADRPGNGDGPASAHAETSGEPDADTGSSRSVHFPCKRRNARRLTARLPQTQGDPNAGHSPQETHRRKIRRRRGRRGGARRRKKPPGASRNGGGSSSEIDRAGGCAWFIRSAPARRTGGGRGSRCGPARAELRLAFRYANRIAHGCGKRIAPPRARITCRRNGRPRWSGSVAFAEARGRAGFGVAFGEARIPASPDAWRASAFA